MLNVQLAIESVNEPATCKYTIVVQLPEVCGHPAFSAASSTTQEQAWLLELDAPLLLPADGSTAATTGIRI
jgi:hypothetical protein